MHFRKRLSINLLQMQDLLLEFQCNEGVVWCWFGATQIIHFIVYCLFSLLQSLIASTVAVVDIHSC